MSVFDWIMSLKIKKLPARKTKAMWCGHRSHPDYSNRFPWIVEKLRSDFNYRNYVEIGIAQAGGLEMVDQLWGKDSCIVGIDPLGEYPEKHALDHPVFKKDHVHLIRKMSCDAVDDLKSILDGSQIDLLVIDGDHTEAGSTADFVDYFPLVREGGLIWLDDIAHEPEVGRTWQKIKSRFLDVSCPYSCWDWGMGHLAKGGIDGVWIVKGVEHAQSI